MDHIVRIKGYKTIQDQGNQVNPTFEAEVTSLRGFHQATLSFSGPPYLLLYFDESGNNLGDNANARIYLIAILKKKMLQRLEGMWLSVEDLLKHMNKISDVTIGELLMLLSQLVDDKDVQYMADKYRKV